MIEQALNNLNTRLQKQEKNSTKIANCFIGDENMHPQIGTAKGWKKQVNNNIEYFNQDDLWLSSQLFFHKLQFVTNRPSNSKTFFLSLTDYVYVESSFVYIDGLCEVALSLGDVQSNLDITEEGLYNLNIEQVLTPLEECNLSLWLPEDIELEFALEIAYRLLL